MEHFYFLSGFLIFAAVLGFSALFTGKIKYRFKFSVRNYYILTSVFLIGIVGRAVHQHSMLPIYLFGLLAVCGVIGETLFSVWWKLYYKNNFWDYKVETLAHDYTSLLNFIPWGVGGFLFLGLIQLFGPLTLNRAHATFTAYPMPFWVIFAITLLTGLALQFIFWLVVLESKGPDFKFAKANFWNYLFFCIPFLFALFSCAWLYGPGFLALAVIFAVAGSAAEYLFGKAVEYFISKKLWTYNYLSSDRGHFTPLAFVGFSLAGFGSWAVALIFYSLVR